MYAHKPNFFEKFFTNKIYKQPGEESSPYDIIIDESKCDFIKKGKPLCEKCYHEALLEKMDSFKYPQRPLFIHHQLINQPDPLLWLNELKGFLFEVDVHEFLDSPEKSHYLQIIDASFQVVREKLDELNQPAKDEAKLIWKRDPDLFFIILSTLYEEGFYDVKKDTNSKVPDLLFQSFQVDTKIGSKEEMKFNTFQQNFKGTSYLQTDKIENVRLKKLFRDFLKSIPY